ncbi:MAG: sigma-70 family RNA polymerase sigma factor [Armatimonadetes bacterium]|nr:sigma-70 family RNA polymerase sigma factor [Armatimonadota bacterium]
MRLGRTDKSVGDLQILPDEDVLRCCASGDQQALRELTRRYQAPIFRFLYRMSGSREDAEEAAMDVFTKAWQHAGRFQYRAKVSTWLYRIAANLARDAHSRKMARPQEAWPDERQLERGSLGSAETDALNTLEREDQARQIREAIDQLNESDRMLIVLYYLEERDYEEMQAITGVSYTVLKTRLARARQRLKAKLEDGYKRTVP